jgi:hypothetical protein
MSQYYVYRQWPSDKVNPPHVTWQTVHLAAGPFDYGQALRVRQEMIDYHNRPTEDNRFTNQEIYNRPNDYRPYDLAEFGVSSVDQLRTGRAAGTIQISYFSYLNQYEPAILS